MNDIRDSKCRKVVKLLYSEKHATGRRLEISKPKPHRIETCEVYAVEFDSNSKKYWHFCKVIKTEYLQKLNEVSTIKESINEEIHSIEAVNC